MRCITAIALAALGISSASAQDVVGSYELRGKYSNNKKTRVRLSITRGTQGLQVERKAQVRSKRTRRSHVWTSSDVRKVGSRLLQVTFRVSASGNSAGASTALESALDGLDAEKASAEDLERALSQERVFRASYLIAGSGRITEYVRNERAARGAWWRWIRTKGQRIERAVLTGLIEEVYPRV